MPRVACARARHEQRGPQREGRVAWAQCEQRPRGEEHDPRVIQRAAVVGEPRREQDQREVGSGEIDQRVAGVGVAPLALAHRAQQRRQAQPPAARDELRHGDRRDERRQVLQAGEDAARDAGRIGRGSAHHDEADEEHRAQVGKPLVGRRLQVDAPGRSRGGFQRDPERDAERKLADFEPPEGERGAEQKRRQLHGGRHRSRVRPSSMRPGCSASTP